MGHPTMQENDTAKLTPTHRADKAGEDRDETDSWRHKTITNSKATLYKYKNRF